MRRKFLSSLFSTLSIWSSFAGRTKANYTLSTEQSFHSSSLLDDIWSNITQFQQRNSLKSNAFLDSMPMQIGLPWHDGELRMQNKIATPELPNNAYPTLSRQAAFVMAQAPLLAIGTLDEKGRPWTSLWGGTKGFARALGGGMLGVKTPVDDKYDAVLNVLNPPRGEIKRQEDIQRMAGKLMAGLTIDLDTQNRVKLAGKMVAGAVATPINDDDPKAQPLVQLVTQIDESMGCCPKYINRKRIKPARAHAFLVSDSPILSEDATNLILRADLFFVSSTRANIDMDTNIRGGPKGFTRVTKDAQGNSVVVWPEYSGNRFYQTLGNFDETPVAGLVFPDFETGDVVYLTGKTEILFGQDAHAVLPRSNLAIRLTVTGARYVKSGLPFRGIPIEDSPYNPRVRPLATETNLTYEQEKGATNSAKLLNRTSITPTISRLKFSMNNPAKYRAGQWVALDFADELSSGYAHMNDADPSSLNDDYVRTFTVSSPPHPDNDPANDTFEVTVRRVGAVTGYMFRHNVRSGAEIPVRGFGGDFHIKQDGSGIVPFVAGGVGITPVLGSLQQLDLSRFKLFWTLHIDDINLAVDTINRYPPLASTMELFITSVKHAERAKQAAAPIIAAGAKVEFRRFTADDIKRPEFGDTWHICVGGNLRKTILQWLQGKHVIYEDFNF